MSPGTCLSKGDQDGWSDLFPTCTDSGVGSSGEDLNVDTLKLNSLREEVNPG